MDNNYKMIFQSEGFRLMHSFQKDTADEVLEHVVYFLLGASFHKDTIMNAMESLVEEHKQESQEK